MQEFVVVSEHLIPGASPRFQFVCENTGDAQGHGEGETGSAHCGYLLGRGPDSLVLRNAMGQGLRPLDAQNDDQSLSHCCAISAPRLARLGGVEDRAPSALPA
jgi:hypothetical protein